MGFVVAPSPSGTFTGTDGGLGQPEFRAPCSLEGHCLVGVLSEPRMLALSPRGLPRAGQPASLTPAAPRAAARLPSPPLGRGGARGRSRGGSPRPACPWLGAAWGSTWEVFNLPSPLLQCERLGRWGHLPGLALAEPHKRAAATTSSPRDPVLVPPSLPVPAQAVLSLSQQ